MIFNRLDYTNERKNQLNYKKPLITFSRTDKKFKIKLTKLLIIKSIPGKLGFTSLLIPNLKNFIFPKPTNQLILADLLFLTITLLMNILSHFVSYLNVMHKLPILLSKISLTF